MTIGSAEPLKAFNKATATALIKHAKENLSKALRDIRKGKSYFENLDDAFASLNELHQSVDEGQTPNKFE